MNSFSNSQDSILYGPEQCLFGFLEATEKLTGKYPEKLSTFRGKCQVQSIGELKPNRGCCLEFISIKEKHTITRKCVLTE